MVISHKHKYIFIETPQTGCSSVRNELIELYDGEPILSKHSVYSSFLNIASEVEKKYFVFSTVRNPLDKTVSTFLKYKADHNNRYTKKYSSSMVKRIFEYKERIFFRMIKKNSFDFLDFLKIMKPFDDISTLDHKNFDFVMRFENINDDFELALKKIGIKPLKKLQAYNKTNNKKIYMDYYNSTEIKKIAYKKMYFFMKYWGYEFPQSFNVYKISFFDFISWNLWHIIRIFTWRYVRLKLKDS